jgi:hypothetical protein
MHGPVDSEVPGFRCEVSGFSTRHLPDTCHLSPDTMSFDNIFMLLVHSPCSSRKLNQAPERPEEESRI